MAAGFRDDKVAIEGSGELNGDLLSGTYTLSSGDADAAVIDVADYDTKAVQDGIWKELTQFPEHLWKMKMGNSYDPFGGMQLIFLQPMVQMRTALTGILLLQQVVRLLVQFLRPAAMAVRHLPQLMLLL